MKVYLSTTGTDLEGAKALMGVLREAGHEITFDWTGAYLDEATSSEEELSERAEDEIDGVLAADAVVVYMRPKMQLQRMTGAAIELGAALGRGLPVVVVEEQAEFDHFFQHHPLIEKVASMPDALAELAHIEGNLKRDPARPLDRDGYCACAECQAAREMEAS